MRTTPITLAFLVLGTVFTACVSCVPLSTGDEKSMLTEVWTKDGWPPADMPPPAGFQITPRGAFEIVAKGKKLSLKHKWVCYRNETHYFIADVFAQSIDAKNALKYGARVNGVTGALE
jgi:hypothetical protein